MAAATPLTGAMMNADEIAAMLAAACTASDALRRAFAAVSDAGDRAAICRQVTAQFDACLWDGSPSDCDDQAHAFPRLGTTRIETEAAIPSGVGATFTAWSTPAIPWAIRAAMALQAGHLAAISLGWSAEAESSSTAHPWRALHARAADHAAPFRRTTFEGV